MYIDEFKQQLPDIDEAETHEWLESLDQVLDQAGENRARFLMYKLLKRARQRQVGAAQPHETRYINTISPEQEPYFPGDEATRAPDPAADPLERGRDGPARERALPGHRRPHRRPTRRRATLYEVGLQPLLPRQGRTRAAATRSSSRATRRPGIYARAFLEGRLSEDELDHFRRETGGKGLSSYPHPRLMPDFWEFPTVSMGLGPLAAIYQARFNRYLANRGHQGHERAAGVGVPRRRRDGRAGVDLRHRLAARDGLDNLTFVVNCNLQRLDGPVRGNGKVIQELEGLFRGAGWNVIKVVWGREWDDLLARDVDGVLVEKMNTTVDGEFQKYSVVHRRATSASTSSGPTRACARLVRAPDRRRHRATAPRRPRLPQGLRGVQGRHRVPGRADGDPRQDRQGLDAGHGRRGPQHHPPGEEAARGRAAGLPRPTRAADPGRPAQGRRRTSTRAPIRRRSRTCIERRRGPRRIRAAACRARAAAAPARARRSTRSSPAAAPTAVSTTMVFARLLRNLIRDPEIGKRIVPIIPDEARTFGLDPLFKEVGIYAAHGPAATTPVDSELAAVVPRGDRRPGPRGGDQRGRARWPASRPPGRRTRRTASR